jgi:hypothetical protein
MGGRAQRDWLHSVPKQARPAGTQSQRELLLPFPSDRSSAETGSSQMTRSCSPLTFSWSGTALLAVPFLLLAISLEQQIRMLRDPMGMDRDMRALGRSLAGTATRSSAVRSAQGGRGMS